MSNGMTFIQAAGRRQLHGQRVPAVVADDDLLTESPTRGAGATRVRQEALAKDGGAGQSLPHLHRHHSHVRGPGQGVGPRLRVLAGASNCPNCAIILSSQAFLSS